MYIFWALLSAITAALRRTNEKQLTARYHPLTISLLIQLCSLPVLLVTALLKNQLAIPSISHLSFWIPLAIGSCCYPLIAYLYLRAVQHGALSHVLPIQSLMPLFLVIFSFAVFRNLPTPLSFLGLLIIVLGIYVLGLKGSRLHHPLQPFREDKSSLLMLLSVILVSAVTILDKIASAAASPVTYSLWSTFGAILALVVMRTIKQVHDISLSKFQLRKFFVTGSLQGTTYVTYLLALSGGSAAYASAIRSSNILMGSMLGIVLLKEAFTIQKKVSFVALLVGILVLALGS